VYLAVALKTPRAEATVRWPPKDGQPSPTFEQQRLDPLCLSARLDLADRPRAAKARGLMCCTALALNAAGQARRAQGASAFALALKDGAGEDQRAPATEGRTALAGGDQKALNELS
jgi:hypothetical protein